MEYQAGKPASRPTIVRHLFLYGQIDMAMNGFLPH